MKQVRVILKSLPYSGRYGKHYRPYSIIEVDADEARDLVESGHGEYVSSKTAEAPIVENMMASPVSQKQNLTKEAIKASDARLEEKAKLTKPKKSSKKR